MATSSIHHVFIVKDPKRAAAFADSLDKAERDSQKVRLSVRPVENKAALKKMLNRRVKHN